MFDLCLLVESIYVLTQISMFGFVLLASGSTSFFLVSLALLDVDFSKWVPQSIGRRFVSYCQLSDGYVHGRNACHGVWVQRVHRRRDPLEEFGLRVLQSSL